MGAERGPPRPSLAAASTREVPEFVVVHVFSSKDDSDRSLVFIVLHG